MFLRIFPVRQDLVRVNTPAATRNRNRRSPEELEIRARKAFRLGGELHEWLAALPTVPVHVPFHELESFLLIESTRATSR